MKDREFYDPDNDWSKKKRGKRAPKKARKGSPARRSRSTGALDKDASRAYSRSSGEKAAMKEMFASLKSALPKTAVNDSSWKTAWNKRGAAWTNLPADALRRHFPRIGKGIKGASPRPKRTPRKDRAIGKGDERVYKPHNKGR